MLRTLTITLWIAASGQIIKPKDLELAAKANTKAAEACEDFAPLEDSEREAAREYLLTASYDNFLLEVFRSVNATVGDDFAPAMMSEVLDPRFVAQTAGPLVASVVFFAIWLLCCCWSPCCRKCRCCRRRWYCPAICKLFFLILLGAIGLGLVVAALLALRGLDMSADGVARTACTSATIVNMTLSGSEDPRFLGLIPVLQQVESVMNSLNEDSKFMTDLRSILDDTEKISKAVMLASTTMSMLNAMMQSQANQLPKRADGTSLRHSCGLCEQLAEQLTPAIETLENSLGTALDAARSEVNKQLTGDKLEELQSSMNQFTAPLQEFTESIHGLFGPFVEQDLLQQIEDGLRLYGPVGVCLFALLAGMLASCGLCSMCCWCRTGRGEVKASAHRCACCTWCCGCFYIWVTFLVGGSLLLASVPLASFCLILDDFSGQTLKDMSGVFGLDMAGPDTAVMLSIVDQCFKRPGESSSNAALLDIITVESNGTGTETMRQKVVGGVTDQIAAQFNALAGGSMGQSISSDATVQMLLGTIQNFSMDAMMLPDSEVATEDPYRNMMLNETLRKFFVSSGACEDWELEGTSTYGIESFSIALEQFGTPRSPPHASCGQLVDCNSDPATEAACNSANSFMELKQGLRTVNTFKCKTFRDESGPCTLVNMTYSGDGAYQSDCFRSDGSLTEMEYDCTLADFTELVKGYSKQLDLAFERLDTVTHLVLEDIATKMRDLVETNVIDKIVWIADGVTCGFMGSSFFTFVDGMCFRGVFGFSAIAASYVACAVLTLLLVILQYMIWRFALDTYELNKQDNAGTPYTGVTVEGQPLTNTAKE